ncbi:MAG TPA: hypothetical protein VGM05_06460 [Planctomycetaceae bacterium]
MRARAFIMALIFLAVIGSGAVVRADGIVRGKVQWTSGNNILVFRDDSDAERRMLVDPMAQITHNGQLITLDQLKLGWTISIYYVDGPNGPVAVTIQAASRFGWHPRRNSPVQAAENPTSFRPGIQRSAAA